MKRNLQAYVIIALTVSILIGGVALAKEYKLSVYMEPQIKPTWCSVSVVQAWVGFKKHICYTQQQIVDGTSYKLRLKANTPLTYLYGWNAGDVEEALETWTGSSFAYRNHNDKSSAFERIKTEIKDQGRPLAISANACYTNGVPKSPQGHWMLIEGLQLKNNNKDFDGAYVKDPLYGSKYASNYEVLRPRTWVRDLFTKWWIPNKAVSKEFRQSVED